MRDHPPLPPAGEAQLQQLLNDFCAHHTARRARTRRLRSAGLLSLTIVLVAALRMTLWNEPAAPREREPIRHAAAGDSVMIAESKIPAHAGSLEDHRLRTHIITAAHRAALDRIVVVRGPTPESRTLHLSNSDGTSIRRLTDDEAIEWLVLAGRPTGIIRIGERVYLADEIRPIGPEQKKPGTGDTTPSS